MLNNPFKKQDKVVFWTDNELLMRKYPITPTSKVMPEWFKKLDPKVDWPGMNAQTSTVKRCPGIMQILNYGYVIRTWCDVVINTDVKHGNVNFEYTENDVNSGRMGVFKYLGLNKPLSIMSNSTFGHGTPLPHNYFKNVLKWNLGWNAWMPKGYDLWYAPIQYNFNPDFTPSTGILDTRITEQLNVQIFWHPTQERVLIPAGTPLVQIIPVPRDELKFEIELDTDGNHTKRLKEKFSRYWLKFSERLNFMNYKYFNDEVDDYYRNKHKEKK